MGNRLLLPETLLPETRDKRRQGFSLVYHFFFPFDLAFEAPALELADATLEARDGAAEFALLPVADLTLSSVLFCTSKG